MKIEVKNGRGFGFNGNKLTTRWDENGNIEKREDGLYIPDLKGPKGTPGGTTVDNHTIIVDDNNKLSINRDVVQKIYSMCAYAVTDRTNVYTYAVDDSTVKTIDDIVDECNAIIDNKGPSWTTYDLKTGDLLQLRNRAVPAKYSSWPVAVDDGNRYNGQTCLALFVVTAVDSSNHYIKSLSIQCLWSSLSQYVKGTTYTK